MSVCVWSELRCRSCGAEFVILGLSLLSCCVSCGIALIGSHSPVSRSLSSRNYFLFSPLLLLVLRLLASSPFSACFGLAQILTIDCTDPLLTIFSLSACILPFASQKDCFLPHDYYFTSEDLEDCVERNRLCCNDFSRKIQERGR